MSRNFLHLGLSLLLVGCFEDSGPEEGSPETGTESDYETSSDAGSDSVGPDETSGDEGTETHSDDPDSSGDTSSEATDEGSESYSDDSSSGESGTDTGSSNTGSSSEDACDEEPVEIPLDEDFSGGDTKTLYIDFDGMPGVSGEQARLCVSFFTNNFSSMRTIMVGDEPIGFGPCVSGGPGPFSQCKPYTKPTGLTEVLIDNSSQTPGCQNGSMEGLVLEFSCPG